MCMTVQHPRMTGKFLPENEAAARLGVPPSVLRGMISNGEITAVRKGRAMVISVEDLDDLLGQQQGRMTGDMAIPEVRAQDEFRQNLVRALDDQVVKQALRQCVGGAGFRDQLLEALDDPGVQGKIATARQEPQAATSSRKQPAAPPARKQQPASPPARRKKAG
jgi:excisionase family DNA binding protein